VLSWRLSITMEASFCIAALEDALALHGKPDIFYTDQGSQFYIAILLSIPAQGYAHEDIANIFREWRIKKRVNPLFWGKPRTKPGTRD
jgi:hypothetical protein